MGSKSVISVPPWSLLPFCPLQIPALLPSVMNYDRVGKPNKPFLPKLLLVMVFNHSHSKPGQPTLPCILPSFDLRAHQRHVENRDV